MYTYWHTRSLHDALRISLLAASSLVAMPPVPSAPAPPAVIAMTSGVIASTRGSGRASGSRVGCPVYRPSVRSDEHTSELQSLMRISYAVCCLKKKNTINNAHLVLHSLLDKHKHRR